ncbi:MAG: type II CRISPR RNA-guided endonuclease Cas9, partial [Alloprevotella sp.]|nr:type II CRISPR RNA-guided endonuclease Cas9 [Alloprevotella sp.]
MRILGLDLGITSIGWALIEQPSSSSCMPQDTKLIDWGSRIFEAGMDDDIESGKGVSRCVKKRLKRSLRIQYSRRRRRRRKLIAILKDSGMLPDDLSPDFFVKTDAQLLDHLPKEQRGKLGHVIPYLYRKMALDRDMKPYELGRALYHLAQRRGYRSNRKQELKGDEDTGKVLNGIRTLKKSMEEAGARTLGEYFASMDPEVERIRSRYTERSMFEHEFRLICERQRHLVSPELEKELHRAIFYQRKLKSSSGLIGECRFEPGEKRCSFMREEAQLFRLYTSVDNLRVESKNGIRPLEPKEKALAVELLNGFNDTLDKSGKITLSELGKRLSLKKGEKFTLGDDEKSIYGNVLNSILYRVFGDRSKTMTAEEHAAFWHDMQSIEKESVLRSRLQRHWCLDDVHADIALKCVLPDDYCSLSLKALRTVLPDLLEGIPLHKILELQYPEKYHSGNTVLNQLPCIDMCGMNLRNPIVHRTLTELRYVVNAIIKKYGKPDYIRIELARNLKSTNKERERITRQNAKNEHDRAAIAARIAKEAGIEKPSRNDILKVMLADECHFECPYTGKSFSMVELLHGGAVHIEHIIPFSRSFDDSIKNKTLCYGEENVSRKRNMTPYEAYQGEQYAQILDRVRHFSGNMAETKLALFELKKVEPAEFLERNLNDTRDASRLAMSYRGQLYGGVVDGQGKRRIQACAGGCTALVRRAWGGNYILGEGEKVRDDHRHHAVDALTIAMITPEMVHRIANMTTEERKEKSISHKPLLGETLLEQGKTKLDRATVSHHVVNKIRGQLHDETIYSKNDGQTYMRKRLDSLSLKDIPLIRDKAIRLAVMQKLGVKDDSQDAVLALPAKSLDIFKDPKNYPTLRDKSGNVVNIIKTVKVACSVSTRTIGKGDSIREVKTNGNYAMSVFAKTDNQGQETAWCYSVVSLFDAYQRLKAKKPVIDRNRDGYVFKFSLRKGDIVTLDKDGKKLICIVRGISDVEIVCTPIQEARQQKELKAAKVWYRLSPSSAMRCNVRKYQ